MKKVIAFVLVIVCLFGLVPSTYAKSLSGSEVADFIQKQFSEADVCGITPMVYYDAEKDQFYIFFESIDVAFEAYHAHEGEPNIWETLKNYAYVSVEVAKAFLDVYGYENSNIGLAYNYKDDDGKAHVFYILNFADGAYTVTDTFTGDTEPVIGEEE